MKTPVKVHTFSERPFPEYIREWIYPTNMKVMNVTQSGSIRWKSYYWVFLTKSLIGKRVAAEDVGNGVWKVFYRDVFLEYFNEKYIREKQQSTRLSKILV